MQLRGRRGHRSAAGRNRGSLRSFGTIRANSEVRYNATDGVLKLELGSASYAWEFVATDGRPSPDEGQQACH